MTKLVIILFLTLGTTCLGTSQNQADSLAQKLLKLFSQKKHNEAFDLAKSSAQSFLKQEEWQKAQDFLKFIGYLPYDTAQVKIFSDFISEESSKAKSINPVEAANLPSYMGAWKARNGQFKGALASYNKAMDELYLLQDTQYLHLIYYRVGQVMQLGYSDPIKALSYADQAERINSKKMIQTIKFEGRISYLRGLAYRSLDWEKSIFYFRKAQKTKGDKDGEIESFITKNLIDLKRFEEAYLSAKKASEKHLTVYGYENGEFLTYQAIALDRLGRHQEALMIMESVWNVMEKHYAVEDPNFIKVFYYKAQILSNSGDYINALENCQKVYTLSFPSYEPSSQTDIPHLDDSAPNQWVLNTLIEHGKILINQFKKTKDTKYLELAQEVGNKSIEEIEFRRLKMDNWDSKQYYNKFLYSAYQQAVLSASMLYQSNPTAENKNSVLAFLKKSKATLLQENINSKSKSNHIPQKILKKEQSFNTSIADLEAKILKLQSKGDSSKIAALKNELFDERLAFTDFKNNNKQYFSSLPPKEYELSPIEKVNKLPNGTAVLGYQHSRDYIICIGFDRDEFNLEIITKGDDFDNHLIQLRKTLSDWTSTMSNPEKSTDSIKNYAQSISKPLLNLLSGFQKKPEHLIIMPDGPLHSIPFELLLDPDNTNRLIDQFDISYAYLFSSLPDANLPIKHVTSFAGFAPTYDMDLEEFPKKQEDANDSKWIALRSGLIDIPEARKSVSELAKRYAGDYWIDKEATKLQFINQAKNFDVLHLGMHSLLNETTNSLSSLVFFGEAENELYLKEIQSMDIPASLVVLSACNTGVGGNVIGEGSLSLARAFFYAGTESTLMSLWQVPDQQTSRIMNLFYKNLEKGTNKGKALADAKRDFLATATKQESHPAFWSGFVLVGDSSPLIIETKSDFFAGNTKYLFFVLIIAIVFFVIRRVFQK